MQQSRTNKTTTKKPKKNKQTQKTKKEQSAFKKWVKRLILSGISILVVAGVGISIYVAHIITKSPTVTQDALIGTMPSIIYDKDGNVVTKLGAKDRILIDPSNIPQTLEDAILSIEDRRFYEHNGIDVIRIAGALLSNIRNGNLQGGSTITQQLIKLSVFSTADEHRTLERKIQEIFLAMDIEKEYTKKDILALYLNKTYLANNTYGFGTAAKFYYNKDIADLTLPQFALLAGMVQAPSSYDPLTHPEEAQKRRDVVLFSMLENHKITPQQYEEATATPVQEGIIDRSDEKSNDELIMDAYIQQVLEEVKTKTNLDPYTQGISIYTHLDTGAQRQLSEILNTNNYITWNDNNIQAAVTIISPKTGAIVAMVGGRNTNVQLGLNRATTNNRSVGSTSKPIIDYGPAIEYLNYSTSTIISDSPIKYTNGPELYNWDKSYMGNMTMRNALVQSRNTTALRTLQAVGLDNARAFLSKLGITVSNNNSTHLVESNAIGFNASTLEMAAAYASLSNGGLYYKPFTISKIITQTGETTSYTSDPTRAMKESTAYMITDMLKGVPGNTAPFAAISGLYHAGKTGTTNYTDEQLNIVTRGNTSTYAAPDAWYVGYSTNYSIATWIGYDNPMQPGNYISRQESYYPTLVYKHIMSYLSKHVNNENWKQPDSVVKYGSELYVKGSSSANSMRTFTKPTTKESFSIQETTSSLQNNTSTTTTGYTIQHSTKRQSTARPQP